MLICGLREVTRYAFRRCRLRIVICLIHGGRSLLIGILCMWGDYGWIVESPALRLSCEGNRMIIGTCKGMQMISKLRKKFVYRFVKRKIIKT